MARIINATFNWPTGQPYINLPPDPNIIAHWTTEKIIYLTYFLAVPIAAIIFLIWVHIRWPEKPVRTKTEVPAQVIEVDKGIEGGDVDGGGEGRGCTGRIDSVNSISGIAGEPMMMQLRELESGKIQSVSLMDCEGKSVRESVGDDDDDMEIRVIQK